MSQPHLYVGEIVDVRIFSLRVAIVSHGTDGPAFKLTTDDGIAIQIPRGMSFTASRKQPADGHPEPGEIWATRYNERYFAQATGGGRVRLIPVTATGVSGYEWRDIHDGPDGPIHRVYQPLADVDGGDQ